MIVERRRADRVAPAAVFVAAFVVHWLQGRAVASPWLLPSELHAANAARSLVEGSPSAGRTLYSFVSAPLWLAGTATAYSLVKLLGALLVAAAAFPTYALARRGGGAALAVVAAALVALAPGTVLASSVGPLPLAYALTAAGSLPLARFLSGSRTRDGVLALALLAAAAAAWPPALFLVVPALLVAAVHGATWRRLLRWPEAATLAVAPAVAYSVFHLARDHSAVFAERTSDAAASLASGGRALGALLLGVGMLPAAALAVRSAPAFAAAASVVVGVTIGSGLTASPELPLLALPLLAGYAAWAAAGASALALAGAVGAAGVAALFAEPGFSGHALAGRLAVSAPVLVGLLLLGALVVAAAVGLALGRARLQPAVVAAAVLALAAAVGGEAAAARDAAGDAPSPERLSGGDVAVLADASTPRDRLDTLRFWSPQARAVSVDDRSLDPETGLVQPPLPPAERYVDLAGLGVGPGGRAAETLEGTYPDGWTGATAVYRRFAPLPGDTLRLTLSRKSWNGPEVPDRVTVSVGRLTGETRVAARLRVPRGQETTLELRVPPAPFRVVVESETFSPASFGESTDTRQLGIRLAVG